MPDGITKYKGELEIMLDYNNYTKRSHVTKAVRFELIPQGKTLDYIRENKDLEQDKALYDALDRLKPVIDSFVKSIAYEALSKVRFDFSTLYEALDNKDTKTADKEEKALRKLIDKCVGEVLPEGLKLSQLNSAKFLQEVLREYVMHTSDADVKKDDAVQDIEAIKGCLPLFGKFLTSRITALSTWMPDRVLENFKIYSDNIKKIERILEVKGDTTEGIEDELVKMASPSYYPCVLTQEDIDGYNRIISGMTTEEGTIEKGLNQRVNEYNQKVKNEKIDALYLRKLTMLYKQILMPQEKKFEIKTITTDDEARQTIKDAWDAFSEPSKKMAALLTGKQAESDGNGVYIKGNLLHPLSHLLTGEHNTITNKMLDEKTAEINEMLAAPSLKASMKKELNKRLEILPATLAKRDYELIELDRYIKTDDKSVLAPGKSVFKAFTETYLEKIKLAETYYKVLEGGDIFNKRKIKGDRHVQDMLVDFFDALTDVRNTISLIKLPQDADGDFVFYNSYDELYDAIRDTFKAENLVRNYITKKEKDLAKVKQTCLGTTARLRTMWWNGEDKFSKENATIIKHNNRYYYFILTDAAKPVEVKTGTDAKLLTLKKGQKSFMMLPKILFKDHATPFFEADNDAPEYVFDDAQVQHPVKVSREIYDIFKKGLFKREAVNDGTITEEEYKENIKKLIDVYKAFARAYVQYEKFDLSSLSNTDTYSDIGEFFSEVDIYTSKLSWLDIEFKQFENLVDNGFGYMFLISNRFLYTGRENKNKYTQMLLSLLSDENMKKTTTLLNSNPAVFFRPQLLEDKPTHKKGSFLVNKRTLDGEVIPKDIYEAIYKLKNGISSVEDADIKKANEYMKTHNIRAFKTEYDISRRKNYMTDKFFLQVTLTKNNDISDRANDRLNDRINEDIKDGFNIISVARSTTDMVYVMALDNKLNVLEEKSLNVIDGIDYAAMLHDAYKEKLNDKKSWVYDTDSADLKSSYIELAITEILHMAKKYNAVIAIESITDNVKDKYSFLDNQVFKAFEKRITERLTDLTFKDIEKGEEGSINNPLQLANNSGSSYQDGILFFVNGAYIRGVEPDTGFTNLFDMTRINSISAKRQFLSKMNSITFDGSAFSFSFDYANFKVKYETEKTKWTANVAGDIVVYDREKKQSKKIDDVVSEVLVPLADGADLKGNLALKMVGKELPGAFVDGLYNQFRYALSGMHRQTPKTREFYRSPVTGKDYNVCHASAYNLAKKLIFRMGYDNSSKGDFTNDWLNYIQD